MVQITTTHLVYLFMIFIILVLMLIRKDIILSCIIGIFAVGLSQSNNILKSIQILYTAIFISGKELWQVILIISLIISMARALDDIGADIIITKPFLRFFKSPAITFWIIGFIMMTLSFFLWPAPAVGLIGAVLILPALKSGMDKLSLASLLSVFGFGAALSGDFFIQGAPSITAKTAGISSSLLLVKCIPIWLTVASVSFILLYIITMKNLSNKKEPLKEDMKENEHINKKMYKESCFISIITVLFFLVDTFLMYLFKIKGNAATALIGGTSILILIGASIIQKDSLNLIREYLKNGFLTGIRTFTPIILISAFFFLGELNTAKQIIGSEAKGYLMDWGLFLSKHIPLNKYTVTLLQMLVGGLTGLSGSGFSGLPLVGALAKTFSHTLNLNTAILASIGQISTIWIGGGTIIPWSIVSVTAIIKVNPEDIAKRNFLPVIIGLIFGYIVTVMLL
ncbi:hypothetical protein ACETAC_03645 [Aceticella autotrophica]|uniref:Citrate transporter n=1 Tax=Aceticella autotrophica TaxID=2755338 RepID=A0A975AX27_9THEO|nr:hypothetical protein ACETAC_03645 [Aceticella autotrophica]